MYKIALILALGIAASLVHTFASGMLVETINHYAHTVALWLSAHHIATEIGHVIHSDPRTAPPASGVK